MAYLGWKPIGDPTQRLLDAIEECKSVWGDDAAYKEVVFKLGQVEQDLDTIVASPGRRAALRALPPRSSGKSPLSAPHRRNERLRNRIVGE